MLLFHIIEIILLTVIYFFSPDYYSGKQIKPTSRTSVAKALETFTIGVVIVQIVFDIILLG